ncbi:MAG: low temperature requirement protein A [Acidimicrobiia bacterium]|nr:low temperature requirement protein A [Acidimicrobiia bacterium]
MRGLDVPEPTEDFTADPVELFFDLAFVFAFSQLVFHLVHHPTWTGAAEAWLLFAMLWMAWSTFTWSANAVSGNARPVRIIFLIATAATLPAAGGVTTAYEDGGAVFAISVSIILAMGLAIQLWAFDSGTAHRLSVIRYARPNLVAMVLWIAGGFATDEARVVLWLAGLGSILYGTIRARRGTWVVRIGHFAERHGLILIVALGEVVVAIGIGIIDSLAEEGGLPTDVIMGLLAAGLFAGLLWWAYFDRLQPALEWRGEQLDGQQRGWYAVDIYTYLHAVIVSGVIISAAALEEIILHPSDPIPLAFRIMLAGGLVMYLLGTVACVGRAFRVVIPERIIASVVVVALVAIGASWSGVVLLFVLDALLFVVLVAEYVRVEGQRSSTVSADSEPAGDPQ